MLHLLHLLTLLSNFFLSVDFGIIGEFVHFVHIKYTMKTKYDCKVNKVICDLLFWLMVLEYGPPY